MHNNVVALKEALQLWMPFIKHLDMVPADASHAVGQVGQEVEDILQVGSGIDPAVILVELQDIDPSSTQKTQAAGDSFCVVPFRVACSRLNAIDLALRTEVKERRPVDRDELHGIRPKGGVDSIVLVPPVALNTAILTSPAQSETAIGSTYEMTFIYRGNRFF